MIHKISVPKPGTPENLLGIKFVADLYPSDSKYGGLRPENIGIDEFGFILEDAPDKVTPAQFLQKKEELIGKFKEIKGD